ncbi:MAG TPA: hypothetical protein VMC83_26565 [Streptosporangiaceae bacterium]|nr:hypothetical protein [Streptosporangiaceae bacterium]
MGTREPMTGLPQPPPDRDLPDLPRHHRELLAVMTARPGLHRAPRWAVPLAAAAAVIAIAVTAAALVPALGHRDTRGGPATGGSTHPGRGAATACREPAGTECQRTDTFTAPAPPGGLTVLDDVGSVTITGSSRDTIAVTERLSYRGYPPVTTRSVNGGVLTLNYRCRSSDCGVAYDIEVPRSLSVRVDADTAPISLTSLAGQVHASSDVGSIRGRNLTDTVADLRTNVGSVEASFRSAPSHLSANADTGSVTLLVPAAPGYAVTASADVGSVSVTVRRDASSDHVIEAFADVGSVTVAGS